MLFSDANLFWPYKHETFATFPSVIVHQNLLKAPQMGIRKEKRVELILVIYEMINIRDYNEFR